MEKENIIELDTEQKKAPKEFMTLKNWAVFGAYWVAVEVYKIKKPKTDENAEDTYTYNPTVTISLDKFNTEGKMPEIQDQEVISLSLDRYFTDPKIAAVFCFQFIKELFAKVSVNVMVYDEKHTIIDQIDLNSFVEQGGNDESVGQN